MIPLRHSEEGVWELEQQTRRLHEHRAELRPTWDDAAAQQVNGRHLNPLAEDADTLVAAERAQHAALGGVARQLTEANQKALEATRAGTAAREALRVAEGELREGTRSASASAALLVMLRHVLLPQIRQAIQSANACGGESR